MRAQWLRNRERNGPGHRDASRIYWTYTNSFRLKSARHISARLPRLAKKPFASFCSAGDGGRESARLQAVFTSQERLFLHSDARRWANTSDCSCMKSLLNSESACRAWVLTGRTGHEVIASG